MSHDYRGFTASQWHADNPNMRAHLRLWLDLLGDLSDEVHGLVWARLYSLEPLRYPHEQDGIVCWCSSAGHHAVLATAS